MMNPTLSDLVGGIHAVTLSDDEAKRRGTQKTVLERKAPPTFDVVIEIIDVDKLAIHHNVERTVDRLLRGLAGQPEVRLRTAQGDIEIVSQESARTPTIREIIDTNAVVRHGRTERSERTVTREPLQRTQTPVEATKEPDIETPPVPFKPKGTKGGIVRVFPYGVSRSRLDRAIAELRVHALVARDVAEADVVMALKTTYQREPGKIREASKRHIPTYVVRSNTYAQIADSVRDIFGISTSEGVTDEVLETALEETQDAIDTVIKTQTALELTPANSYTRRLQHQLVERSQLFSESVGVEPYRRVRILPVGASA